jgi:hypothetical protein
LKTLLIFKKIACQVHFSTVILKKIAKIVISTAFWGKVKISPFSTFFRFLRVGGTVWGVQRLP